jgi:inhibitor of cysteine peptidase
MAIELQKTAVRKSRLNFSVAIVLIILLLISIYSFNLLQRENPTSGSNTSTSASPEASSSPISSPTIDNSLPTSSPTSNPTATSVNPSPYPVSSSTPSQPPSEEVPMETFSSSDALAAFLVNNTQGGSSALTPAYAASQAAAPTATPGVSPTPNPTASLGSPTMSADAQYSTTNIQVSGVDEADKVKNDGNYIYTISNQTVYIVNANPRDARVLSRISFNKAFPTGLFLSQDGNRLAVLGTKYEYEYYPVASNGVVSTVPFSVPINYPTYILNRNIAFVCVYDISNKANALLVRNFTMSGRYFNSRMINNYLYTVIVQPAYVVNKTAILPWVYSGTSNSEVPASSIFYTSCVDTYYVFTTFVSINLSDEIQQASMVTIMTGGASNMYVSTSNIYLTYSTWNWQVQPLGAQTGVTSSPIMMPPILRYNPDTIVYRISVAGAGLTFEAQGRIPGTVLNQYAMNEYNNIFMAATTSWINGVQQNNVYTLNASLKVVGKLENIATGENLYAARFVQNKCYLVTFLKTDPLFVIDLNVPTKPTALGSLNVTGFSDYIQPYDDTHLIGFGKETIAASQGNFAWYQGLKLSLFDVTDVNNPLQLSASTIGDRGTTSQILQDPKALLFDKTRGLLVIPVNLAIINRTTTPPGPNAFGTFVWQGAYVFSLDLAGGFVLRGNVTHILNPISSKDNSYSMSIDKWITRELYIGDTLYTISNSKIMLTNLATLQTNAEINLGP